MRLFLTGCFKLTQTSFFVRDKNSRFFEVRDKNSRSSGQNKFLPSLGTKIKTFVTTRNFCTLPWDKLYKILILYDKNQFQKVSRPKNGPKTLSFYLLRKKSLSKKRKCFFLVSEVFILCEFVFLYIPGEKHDNALHSISICIKS